MIDPFGREVNYLRVSVTDRCDFRCFYCMSESMTFLPKAELLSLEELDRLCSAFVRKGVRKLRITGGEPLVRRDIIRLFQLLSRHLKSGALHELTVTTNGSQLARYADDLAAAGVRRINVSVDSLNEEKFSTITRRGNLSVVMDGLRAAKEAGLQVKINTVALRGGSPTGNEDEILDMVKFCGDQGFDLTFIETMPMGDIGGDRTGQYLPLTTVRDRIESFFTLDDSDFQTGGPARYVSVAKTGQRIGFISPLSHNFCESCNRVRVTCTGMLYMCLGQMDKADLRAAIRASSDDGFLDAAIDEAIGRKPKGHDFIIDRGQGPAVPRHMSVTGG